MAATDASGRAIFKLDNGLRRAGQMANTNWSGTMWNQRYDRADYLFGTAPAQFLADQQGTLQAGHKALVIADGEGRNSVYLAQKGLQVTAMDSAETGLAKARALAAQRGVNPSFILADLRDWVWQDDAYDLVVAVFIQFAEPAFRTKIFDGMKRTVKPGGRVMLHGFAQAQMQFSSGGPKVLENLYSEAMLADAFHDFHIERLASYEAPLNEGPGHSGPAALIDLIAQNPV
jgi:cyclopropane fatty-acyl-phospholipid synthase-like methyltransferase